MNKVELIDKYLHDQLNDRESEEFQNFKMIDSKFENEILLHKGIEESIMENDVVQLRSELTTIFSEVNEPIGIYDRKEPKTISLFTRRKLMYTAAVVTLLITISGFFIKQHLLGDVSNNQIFEKYYEPYQTTVAYRSGDEDIDQVLLSAMQKYEFQEYEEAVNLFEQILVEQPKDMAVNLYSGISYLEIEKLKKANKSFKVIIDDENNLFLEQAKWYLALCYIKTDSTLKAQGLLIELSVNNSYYQDKADKILKALK